jgi:2-oxoglutarate ferredoxin oxidoreductase subunit beta
MSTATNGQGTNGHGTHDPAGVGAGGGTPISLGRKDFMSDQEMRWCPGCGDYGITAALQLMLPDLGVAPHELVFVSGIGCAARLPYYMNTYGIHSIHGRAPAVATGVAMTRPDLSVWVIGGDGDMLSIGANHLLQALRRNVDLKILMFNNQIYGLTKGQYSPTSEIGKITKSTPFGSIDQPFNPVSVALGAEATFVARTHEADRGHMQEVFRRAYEHKGAAFVEVYQNCNVFNDGAFDDVMAKEHRADMMIPLRHGEPVRFGSEDQFGVFQNEYAELVVDRVADRDGAQLVVHDEHRPDPTLAFALSRLASGPHTPTPIGVFRDVDRPLYELEVAAQVDESIERQGRGDLAELIRSGPTWTVT